MADFVAPSGKTVTINAAAWQDAKKLKMAVQREAGSVLEGKLASGDIAGLIMRVDGSEAVDAALWPCLARCLRDGKKITEQTFDDESARADYYDIVLECLKVNFGPLVANLASKLPEGLLKKKETYLA